MRDDFNLRSILGGAAVVAVIGLLSSEALAGDPIALQMEFRPATIGASSTSRLTYTVDNQLANPVADLSIQTDLPEGMVLAPVPNAQTTCTLADVQAVAGQAAIRVQQGRLAALGSCDVSVNVVGTLTGTSTGTLSSSAGGAFASAILTVDTERPGFAATFSPNEIAPGADSLLTLTFDNTTAASDLTSLSLTSALPDGLVISELRPAVSTCGDPLIPPSITANSGERSFTLSANGTVAFPVLRAGAECVLEIGVEATRAGSFLLETGELSFANASSFGETSGFATAVLRAPARPLTRVFRPRQVAPGGSIEAVYSLTNLNRNSAAEDISFTDDVGLAVSGVVLTAVDVDASCGAAAVAVGVGSGALEFSGGSLPPEGRCTFVAVFAVPAAAPSGAFAVTSSPASYFADGQPRTWDAATDILTVAAAPRLEKSNSGPVGSGGVVTLSYVVTNTSDEVVSGLTFDDPVPMVLPGVIQTFPTNGFCGAAATMGVVSAGFENPVYRVSGAELAPFDSCTFDVEVTLPQSVGEPGGVEITSTNIVGDLASGGTVVGAQATDTLEIVAGPRLTKAFSTSVAAGELVDVVYTLDADEFQNGDVGEIAFTDAFDALVPGLLIESASVVDVCGAGSAVTVIGGQTAFDFTGGTLAPGATCSFTVQLSVPSGAAPGLYVSTTSDVTSSTGGVLATSSAASATLIVDGVRLSMQFPAAPTSPGAETTLFVTLENATNEAASDGFLTFPLNEALTGMAATNLPAEPCGAGSSLSGTTFVIATGLNLPALGTCTFEIPILIPPGESSIGQHSARASGAISLETSGNATIPTATAPFVVADPVLVEIAFPQPATRPGENADLQVTLSNASSSSAEASFTLDLDSAPAGTAAVGLPLNDICGAGSSVSLVGDEVTFAAPSIAPESTCTFSVSFAIPDPTPAARYTVSTSEVTVLVDGTTSTIGAMSAAFDVFTATLLAAFDGPVIAGGTATLSVSIDSTDALSDVDLAIDLERFIPGATAAGLPLDGVCGEGTLSGSSSAVLRGAATDDSNPCVFAFGVQIPEGTAPGAYSLSYGPLTQAGEDVAEGGAPAVLRVEPPPQLSVAVNPSVLSTGATTDLTFDIDNSASLLAATALAFDVELPAGVTVSGPTSSTCEDGTITAIEGEATITIEDASVAAASACSIVIALSGDAGVYLIEEVTLVSSNGSSTSDAVDLTFEDAVSMALAAEENAVFVGSTTRVTASFANPSVDRAAADLAVDFEFIGVAVAEPLNAETNCGGSVDTTLEGLGFSGGTLAAGEDCSIAFDVVGDVSNADGEVTSANASSSLGPLTDAAVSIAVEGLPTFTAAFDPVAIALTESSDLTLTLIGAASLESTGLTYAIDIPSALTIEAIASPSAGCVGGSVSEADQTVRLSAASLAPGSTCVLVVTVQPTETGIFDLNTSPLSTEQGDGDVAAATLTVTEDGPEPEPEPGVEPGVEPEAEPEPDPEPGQGPEGTPEADPPADGCGCTASSDHTRSSPLGILALLWGVALLRRRRRIGPSADA